MIKARDLLHTGKIHSSDFRTAITDLGFPMGSQVVTDILVHCRIDPNDGNIDYSRLEEELARERNVVINEELDLKRQQQETHAHRQNKMISSSLPQKSSPWRANVQHKEKLHMEHQFKVMQEHRKELHDIFRRFVHSEASMESVIDEVRTLNINPTRQFLALLNQNQGASEIKFAEFMKSLVTHDTRNSVDSEADPPAGALHPSLRPAMTSLPECDHGIFTQFRRKLPGAKALEMQLNANIPEKTVRKLHFEINPVTGERQTKMRSSTDIRTALTFNPNSSPTHPSMPPPPPSSTLLSLAHQEMQNGVLGEDIQLGYTSEQKLLREQVLAALRKLDAGELSLPEFQDKVFAMGFELPQAIYLELQRSFQSGQLNWRRCVEILDAEVFKIKALHERITPEEVESARIQLLQALEAEHGASSLSGLRNAFERMDTDRSNTLSLNEFKAGILSYCSGHSISEAALRVLFNSCDFNGDGVLQLDEFLRGIRGEGRMGEIAGGSPNASRLRIIRNAFLRLNRTGRPVARLEDIVNAYDLNSHPDVKNGLKSAREVQREFILAINDNVSF